MRKNLKKAMLMTTTVAIMGLATLDVACASINNTSNYGISVASASNPEMEEVWRYCDTTDGAGIRLTSYIGTELDVIIPETINGKKVTELGQYLFDEMKIVSVDMPDTIVKIDTGAFYECTELKELQLSSELQEINTEAFYGCKNITSIEIPNSVISLDITAFTNTGITTLFIPESVTKIEFNDFIGAPRQIECYEVSSENEVYASEDGMLLSKDKSILYFYPIGRAKKEEYIIVPSYVEEIYDIRELYVSSLYVFVDSNVLQLNGKIPTRAYKLFTPPDSTVADNLRLYGVKFNPASKEDFIELMRSEFEILYYENDAWTVYEYYGNEDVMEIPEQVGTLPLTQITNCLFSTGKEEVYKVIIPESIDVLIHESHTIGVADIISESNIRVIINESEIEIPLSGNRWFDAECGGKNISAVAPNSNAYKCFSIKYYNYRPGSQFDMNIEDEYYAWNKEITLPKAPEIKGYHFVGWKNEDDDKFYTKVEAGTNKDLKFRAVYEEIKSSGSSVGSGGGGGSSSGGGGGSSSGGSGGGGGGGSFKKTTTASANTVSLPEYVVKGTWTATAEGDWTFTDANGLAYKNKWAAVYNPYANTSLGQENFDWFFFDTNGNMATGWVQDNGLWYYLSPVSDGTKGKMVIGWLEIEGKWYYFNPESDGTRGKMITNTWIGNDYLDKNGVWTTSR